MSGSETRNHNKDLGDAFTWKHELNPGSPSGNWTRMADGTSPLDSLYSLLIINLSLTHHHFNILYSLYLLEPRWPDNSQCQFLSLLSPAPLVQIVDLKERKWQSTVDPDTSDTQNLQRQTLNILGPYMTISTGFQTCCILYSHQKELLSILDLRITLNAAWAPWYENYTSKGRTDLPRVAREPAKQGHRLQSLWHLSWRKSCHSL